MSEAVLSWKRQESVEEERVTQYTDDQAWMVQADAKNCCGELWRDIIRVVERDGKKWAVVSSAFKQGVITWVCLVRALPIVGYGMGGIVPWKGKTRQGYLGHLVMDRDTGEQFVLWNPIVGLFWQSAKEGAGSE